MKTDSVNFTDDLINGFCEESGTDELMMRRMYEHYTLTLQEKLRNNSEAIEVPIRHLGIFFMPLHGAIIVTNRKKRQVELFGEHMQERVDFFEARKEAIKKRIDKCKSCGIKNIRFLHTLINKDYIKNQ